MNEAFIGKQRLTAVLISSRAEGTDGGKEKAAQLLTAACRQNVVSEH